MEDSCSSAKRKIVYTFDMFDLKLLYDFSF